MRRRQKHTHARTHARAHSFEHAASLSARRLAPPELLVLDEAFDGLDHQSRDELRAVLLRTLHEPTAAARRTGALALIANHPDDLVPPPTHALLLGQGTDGTGYAYDEWSRMLPTH